MTTLGLGVGIILSLLATKYRDLVSVVGFGTQIWMYATPIVYPLSEVPSPWQWLACLNPMTTVVGAFRYGLLGKGRMRLSHLSTSLGVTVALSTVGLLLFSRLRRTSMDTV